MPRFLAALADAGVVPVRAEAYLTTLGAPPEACAAEVALMAAGHVHAVAISSTAEVQGMLLQVGGVEAFKAIVTKHQVLLAAHGPYSESSIFSYNQELTLFNRMHTQLQKEPPSCWAWRSIASARTSERLMVWWSPLKTPSAQGSSRNALFGV